MVEVVHQRRAGRLQRLGRIGQMRKALAAPQAREGGVEISIVLGRLHLFDEVERGALFRNGARILHADDGNQG